MAKVLLVEDDNNLREIYEARLTAEGYDIVTAQNGEEALSVAKQQKPDLVISDVMMPRISGFEMLDILRNTDELKNTKVIMLTALGQTEDRGRADNLGADKYLVKSQVTLEDIVNAAKALLSDEPGAITTPTAPPEPVLSAAPVTATSVVEIAGEPETTPEVSVPAVAAPAEPVAQVTQQAAVAEPNIPDDTLDSPSVTPPVTTFVVDEPTATPVLPIAAATPTSSATTSTDDSALVDDSNTDETTGSESTTVTVADPDPIVPHISPVAELLSAEDAVTVASPLAEPATVVPQPFPAPSAEFQTQPVQAPPSSAEPQTLAAEEAAIEAQIASFATADDESPAPAPTPAQTNNDAVLDDAMSKLTTPDAIQASSDQDDSQTTDINTPSSPTPSEPVTLEVTPEAVEPVDPSGDTTSQIAGRKVIQPISEAEAGTPNLEALLAKEAAKEAAYNEANPRPVIMGAAPDSPPEAGVDPNSIAL